MLKCHGCGKETSFITIPILLTWQKIPLREDGLASDFVGSPLLDFVVDHVVSLVLLKPLETPWPRFPMFPNLHKSSNMNCLARWDLDFQDVVWWSLLMRQPGKCIKPHQTGTRLCLVPW